MRPYLSLASVLCVLLCALWGCPPTDTPVNAAPTAEDDEATVTAGLSIDIEVLENDSDPEDDDLEIVSITEPEHGSAEIDRDEIEYEADEDFAGEDSFEYTIDDGNGNQATATVEITVSALPTLIITSPQTGAAIEGRTVSVTFEVTGCEVSRPSEDDEGCHLHRYLDTEGYTNPDTEKREVGWYETAGFDVLMGAPGEHTFVLRLTKNDGSDDAWEPEVLDSVTFTTTAEGDDDDSAGD